MRVGDGIGECIGERPLFSGDDIYCSAVYGNMDGGVQELEPYNLHGGGGTMPDEAT